MAQVTTIHSYYVSHEPNAESGINYLRNLSDTEVKLLFEGAKKNSTQGAEFEDHGGLNFTLMYQGNVGGGNHFVLIRR